MLRALGVIEDFYALTPEVVLRAVEAAGVPCTGLCYALNSLENRVYELEREDRSRVVAKFYRPGRWRREAIEDEHRFLFDLRDAEVPVAAPLSFGDGSTLYEVIEGAMWCALFPKVGGRAPEELTPEQLRRLGMLLARVHNVGAARAAPHRRRFDAEAWGLESLSVLTRSPRLAPTLRGALTAVTERLLAHTAGWFDDAAMHRVHGDCHLGNLLWGAEGAFFLDFDDMMVGPAVQDVWLLTPGRDAEAEAQRAVLVSAYEGFRAFDRESLKTVEALRALRYLHYAAWVTRRYDDPAFRAAFPAYGTDPYFIELISDLEEQLLRLGGTMPAQHAAAAPPEAPAKASISVREVSVEGDAFLPVMMVRDEVFLEELQCGEDTVSDRRDRACRHLLARMPNGEVAGVLRVEPGPALSLLAVLPHLRRRGVARALIAAACALGDAPSGRAPAP